MADKSQKTEKPTPQRRRQAREEGNVPRTNDLPAWLTILVFLVVGQMVVGSLQETFASLLDAVGHISRDPDIGVAEGLFRQGMLGALGVVAPLLLGCMVVGSLGFIVQGGVRVSSKRFKPHWKKLNPATGLKQLVSAHAAWTLAKTLLKFVVFGFIAYQVLTGSVTRVINSGQWSLGALVDIAQGIAMDLFKLIALVGLVIAAADYAMERRRNEKSLKMSREEIKQESKNAEGDPHLRGFIRSRQRDIGRRRMMADVGTATVVVVNPTHVAVALRYEAGQGAPEVVAKGAGYLAQRIREEAEAHSVPMVRDPLITRALFKACEVGQHIPAELYDAIAQVLAFVMRLADQGRGEGTHESPVKHPQPLDGPLPEHLTDAALGISSTDEAA